MIDPNKIISDANCVVCGTPPEEGSTDQRYIQFHDRKIFLCGKHAEAFHIGAVMGQLELNSALAEFILKMDDPLNSQQIKEHILEMVPSARRQLEDKQLQAHIKGTYKEQSPREIYEYLDKNVIGQEEAKRRISLAVYEHYKNAQRRADSPLLEKQNILMLGPSGSGKTLIANSIAKILDVPFVSADATSYSPTGFQGADVDTIIFEMMYKSSGVHHAAEQGIAFIDEIDKLSTHAMQGTKSEGLNYATQSSLLKLIEGKKVKVPMQNLGHPPGTMTMVDTTKMLFMFGGAFNGLAEQVGKLMGYSGRTISLSKRNEEDRIESSIRSYNILAEASTDVIIKALIDFGMNTEFIGRIPIIVPLAPLTKEQLYKCLIDLPNSPVSRSQMLFAESGVKLEFEESMLQAVVETTAKSDTGTRALNTLVKRAVSQAAFDLLGSEPSRKIKHVVITNECIANPESYVTIN